MLSFNLSWNLKGKSFISLLILLLIMLAMCRLLLFLSNNTDINSIISSPRCLGISVFPPRYMFSAANAWIETNPRASELLNFSKSWFLEIILSVFIKYGVSGLETTTKSWEPRNLPCCWKNSQKVSMILWSENSFVLPKLIK